MARSVFTFATTSAGAIKAQSIRGKRDGSKWSRWPWVIRHSEPGVFGTASKS